MFKILDKDGESYLLKVDGDMLKKIEDIYDKDPNNYEDLSLNLDPKDVLDFIDTIDGGTAKKVHKEVSLQNVA